MFESAKSFKTYPMKLLEGNNVKYFNFKNQEKQP